MLYFKILKNSKKGVFSEDSFCTGLIISWEEIKESKDQKHNKIKVLKKKPQVTRS